jgi:hypothetical protein
MVHTPNKWETLQNRAKEFIKQTPLTYYGLSPAQIPNEGGIYLITLTDENGEETPLHIGQADNLNKEVLLKQIAHSIKTAGAKMYWPFGEVPKIISNPEFAANMTENCHIRFLTEPDIKERMALTVAVTLQMKPLHLYN